MVVVFARARVFAWSGLGSIQKGAFIAVAWMVGQTRAASVAGFWKSVRDEQRRENDERTTSVNDH